MNAKILFYLMLLLLGNCSLVVVGQDHLKYYQLVGEASQLYDSSEYLKSGQKYSEAFVALGNKGIKVDRYNAACSWALAGEADSSFSQLFFLAEKDNLKGYDFLTSDTDLNPLHQDPRWAEVLEMVRLNKEVAEAKYNKALIAILDTILQDDQFLRQEGDVIIKKYGWEKCWESEEMKVLVPKIQKQDSINLVKVEEIINTYGWLGADVVGEQGNQTLWLVLQHSDMAIQEKYLPLMREAVKNGKASANDLAYLEDRVALGQGKKQIYGSQIGFDRETQLYYVSPMEDPDNVDKRRAEVGLPPLTYYVIDWQIKWDVEQYKKDLPGIEAMEKESQK